MSKFVKYDNRIYMRHWFKWYFVIDMSTARVKFEPSNSKEKLK